MSASCCSHHADPQRGNPAYKRVLWIVLAINALVANGACAALLYAYRDGDANMQSVWICSRNDVLGNFAVLLAAVGVFGTGTGWPDLIVATIMATLALQGAWIVVRQARAELRSPAVKLAVQISN
jgi:Co/Zn/Cd efflux system component